MSTEVKDRPLIMYPHEVRAVRDGKQTQFRRVMKQQPVLKGTQWTWNNCSWTAQKPHCPTGSFEIAIDYCPYGVPGDRLFVKETFRITENDSIYYRADEPYNTGKEWGWRPSIHMPRWASRLLLEVVSVRVERLQEISEEDVIAEGCGLSLECEREIHYEAHQLTGGGSLTISANMAYFGYLWDSINGKAHPWGSNPWVWATEFKLIENRG